LNWRSIFHFLSTAILTSVALSLSNLVWIGLADPESLRGPVHVLVGLGLFWAVTFPFVVAGGLVVGLPLHAALRRAGLQRPLHYMLVGLPAGAAAAVILGSLFMMSIAAMVPFALYGAVAGGSAGLIWRGLSSDGAVPAAPARLA
jgi:hypothetical protein